MFFSFFLKIKLLSVRFQQIKHNILTKYVWRCLCLLWSKAIIGETFKKLTPIASRLLPSRLKKVSSILARCNRKSKKFSGRQYGAPVTLFSISDVCVVFLQVHPLMLFLLLIQDEKFQKTECVLVWCPC